MACQTNPTAKISHAAGLRLRGESNFQNDDQIMAKLQSRSTSRRHDQSGYTSMNHL